MSDMPLTLREFFYQGGSPSPDKMSGMQSCSGPSSLRAKLSHEVSSIGWSAVFGQITDELGDLLDVGIADILVAAWKKHRMLQRYLDREAYPPSETIMVHLAEHTVRSVHRPAVEVWVDEQKVGEVDFTVDLALTIKGAILRIQGGRIKELLTGSCTGKGALSCEEFVLIEKETEPVPLPGSIGFGAGIPLALV